MKTPEFFKNIPSITLRDPLAEVLGAAENGILTYTYEDIVKLSGHSCPTVAGAYLMVQKGLESLYGKEIPVRGAIKVHLKGKLGDSVVGVISNVASMITGATDISGFHGLAGKFDRRNLLSYEADITGEIALERVDTQNKVILSYDPSFVAPDPRMGPLLSQIASGSTNEELRVLFATLWQDRVKRILINSREDDRLIQCHLC
ncbi:MAG: hypothetical protein WC680_07465 [Sulfuricurvum sp.]|jgi:hypothetical protein